MMYKRIMTERKEKALDRETLILRKCKAPVLQILRNLAYEKRLAGLCRERFNMAPARLTELHTERRELTPYYLAKLVSGGIVKIETILQGKKLEELPREDQLVLKKIFMEDEEIEIYWKAKEKGVNVKAYLKQLIGEE